jgi:hypothetical protein
MDSSREGSADVEGDAAPPCSNGVSGGEEEEEKKEKSGDEGEEGKEEELEGDVGEGMEGEPEKADSTEQALFHLTVVNSYGSQEVQKLEKSRTYKLTSEGGREEGGGRGGVKEGGKGGGREGREEGRVGEVGERVLGLCVL